MLSDFKCSCPVYLAYGYTDLRRWIDGLAGLVQTQFRLDPFQNARFLFCGRRKDRIKGLYWEGNGFVLLYKRLESGSFQWPRDGEEERVCPQCGELMQEIGSEVRETLVLVPTKAVLRKDVYYTYACESCEKNDISTPIVKAPKEPAVIPGSFASPEAIAHIAVQKFAMYVPLYRMGRDSGSSIVLCEYQPSRKAEHAAKFLEGFPDFSGLSQTAGKYPGSWLLGSCSEEVRRGAQHPAARQAGGHGSAHRAGILQLVICPGGAVQDILSRRADKRKQHLKEEKPILDALLA